MQQTGPHTDVAMGFAKQPPEVRHKGPALNENNHHFFQQK